MATKYEWYNPSTDNNYFLDTTYLIGQTFTIGTTGTNENFNLSSIKLRLFRLGSPGTLTFAIRAVDGSGLPTGSDLSTGTTNGNTLSDNIETADLREITMSSYTLQASTKYAIIAKAQTLNFDVDMGFWLALTTSPSYTGGAYVFYESNWDQDTEIDFEFEVWGGTGAAGTNIIINVGDTWRNVDKAYVNVSDTWREVTNAYMNVSDAWKTIF